jgi:hypothetical protein
MTIDKALLLAALLPITKTVPVAGFGDVLLRQITVAENDAIREAAKDVNAASEFGLRLLVAAVSNADGTPVFTVDDLPALRASAGTKIDALVKAVLDLNGYQGEPAKNSNG